MEFLTYLVLAGIIALIAFNPDLKGALRSAVRAVREFYARRCREADAAARVQRYRRAIAKARRTVREKSRESASAIKLAGDAVQALRAMRPELTDKELESAVWSEITER